MTTRSTNGLPWIEDRLRVSPPYYRVPADKDREMETLRILLVESGGTFAGFGQSFGRTQLLYHTSGGDSMWLLLPTNETLSHFTELLIREHQVQYACSGECSEVDQTRGDPFETPSKGAHTVAAHSAAMTAFSNASIINLSTESLYAVQLHPVLMGSVVHLYLTVAFKDTWAPEEETVQWGMLPMPTQESIDDFQAVGGGFSWDQQQIVERIYSQAPFHILGEPIQQQAPGTWLRLVSKGFKTRPKVKGALLRS
ncbi:hypothetical protein M231_01922 [Tremella mesenterica]|uniref:Uncharacterized protein n=1 Tax=Tremella mesenterica TaxID=5217 RepID=A0A4Q1BS75_TREME|nr:hypothetical protein M231_01922 [Tremella mesenterica]